MFTIKHIDGFGEIEIVRTTDVGFEILDAIIPDQGSPEKNEIYIQRKNGERYDELEAEILQIKNQVRWIRPKRRKKYVPSVEVSYPEFGPFKIRIVKYNSKILPSPSFDFHYPFFIFWLKKAKNKFLSLLSRIGEGGKSGVIFLTQKIAPENFEDDDEEDDDEREYIEIETR